MDPRPRRDEPPSDGAGGAAERPRRSGDDPETHQLPQALLDSAPRARGVADVTRRDVERAVRRLPNATRNRVLALVSRLFNLFETWEWRPQHTNPARGVERAREEARDRVLDSGELAALSAGLGALEERFPASVGAIRVDALTGLRISEVCAIRWEHVDFESGRVTLPGSPVADARRAIGTAMAAAMAGGGRG